MGRICQNLGNIFVGGGMLWEKDAGEMTCYVCVVE